MAEFNPQSKFDEITHDSKNIVTDTSQLLKALSGLEYYSQTGTKNTYDRGDEIEINFTGENSQYDQMTVTYNADRNLKIQTSLRSGLGSEVIQVHFPTPEDKYYSTFYEIAEIVDTDLSPQEIVMLAGVALEESVDELMQFKANIRVNKQSRPENKLSLHDTLDILAGEVAFAGQHITKQGNFKNCNSEYGITKYSAELGPASVVVIRDSDTKEIAVRLSEDNGSGVEIDMAYRDQGKNGWSWKLDTSAERANVITLPGREPGLGSYFTVITDSETGELSFDGPRPTSEEMNSILKFVNEVSNNYLSSGL